MLTRPTPSAMGPTSGQAGIPHVNPQEAFRALERLAYMSTDQLLQTLQSGTGSVPAYAVLSELQSRKDHAAKLANAGAVPPNRTVKDDLTQHMAQASGLPSLAPQGQPMAQQAPQGQPMGMAAGGMIPGLASGRRPEDYGDYPTLSPTYLTDAYAGQPYVAPPEELTYEEKLRAQGLNPLGGRLVQFMQDPKWQQQAQARRDAISGYVQDPNRKPLFDVAMDKIGSNFKPTAKAPAFNIPDRVYSMGNIGQKPPLREVNIPPYTDTPNMRVAGGGKGGPTSGLQGVAVAAGYTPKEVQYGNIEDELKGYPEGTGIKEYIKSLKDSDTSAKDRNQAIAMGLMNAGFKTMSTAGPTLSAMGTGAQEGLRSFATQDAENRYYENQRRKELGAASMAEDARQMQRYGIGRQAVADRARLGFENEGLRQRAAEAAQHSADTRYTADSHVRAAGIGAGASRQAMVEAARERMIQGEYAKAVEQARKELAPNMKYTTDQTGTLLQRDAEQVALRRMRMIKDADKYFNFPSEEAAPNPYQVFEKPGGKSMGKI